MVFSNALAAVMTIFCIGFLGYLLRRKGWISDETAKVMPKFLTAIVLPLFLLRTVISTFEHDKLLALISGTVVPFLSIALCHCIAHIVAFLFKIRKGRRYAFMVSFSSSNAMNIGLPVSIALFGEEALPFALLFFFANLTSFWTYGNYFLAKDSDTVSVKIFSLHGLKQIFSPPLIGLLLGLLMVMLNLQLPAFLDKTFKYVGDMTVPIAIIYIGVLLESVNIKDIHFERDVLLVFAGRFLVAPLCVLLVARIFPIPAMMLNVFMIQASLPVMMNVAVLSGFYKTDVKYVAILVSATTLLSLGTVPLWTFLCGYLLH